MLTTGLRYEVGYVLLQKPPMCLLDTIDGYGPDWIRAGIVIRRDALFFEPGLGVPGWVGLEFMAQAAAAYGGIEQRQRGEALSIGLLIGTRHYHCRQEYFPAGMKLAVVARLLMRDENDFVAYECGIECASQAVADAVLKACRPRDIGSLLAGGGP